MKHYNSYLMAFILMAFLLSMENGIIKHLVPVYISGNETIATMNDFNNSPQIEESKTMISHSFDPLIFIRQLLKALGVNYD